MSSKKVMKLAQKQAYEIIISDKNFNVLARQNF